MTLFPHKIILHRLGIVSSKDDKTLQSRGVCTIDHHATILAFSMFKRDDTSVERILRTSESGRRLLSDKKLPFEQFEPRRLLISTARVIAMQASTTVSHFLTDQLDSEMKREQLVKEGKLTEKEADEQNERWEEREWSARWSNFGTKCVHGVLKFHAITLVMRFYEHTLTARVDEIVLDRLTKDPFKAAKRTAQVTGDSKEIIHPMFQTCLWSNVIAFLADYTVHQVILAFTYYMYCREKKRRRIQDRQEEDESEDGAMAMSFAFKSCKLMVSRGLGLLAAAAGGAVGSYVYPGWGTTIGTSFGDGLMATALEERT